MELLRDGTTRAPVVGWIQCSFTPELGGADWTPTSRAGVFPGFRVETGRGMKQIARSEDFHRVPAFNEERLLGESLAQIKSAAHAFAQRGWDFELIVCDNIPPTARPKSRGGGATIVFEPVNQIARARNAGAAAATATG